MKQLNSASFHSTDRETHAEYTVRTTSKGAYCTAVIVGFQGKYKMVDTIMVRRISLGCSHFGFAHALAAITVTASFALPHPHREHNVI